VGRNGLDGALKKGGFKVHAMMDAFSGVTEFVRLTEAREDDQKFLYHLKLAPHSWIVFDKAYTPMVSLPNGRIRKCGLLPGSGLIFFL
jgi:hypothetical protein